MESAQRGGAAGQARPFLGRPGPVAFAHRGGAGLWPENTLLAFESAAAAGCVFLETDVRMSRDGELVLFHDATLERTTNGRGRVSEHTLAELKRLDAGHAFTLDGATFPFRGRGLEIPTLAELTQALPEARVNIEIKERGPRSVPQALARFLERHALGARFCVAADEHALMAEFRFATAGGVATSASRRECLLFWAARGPVSRWLRPAYSALQVPSHAFGRPLVTPCFVRRAHRANLSVHVWTINAPDEMRRLLDLGVDGLFTDRPDRLLGVIEEVS